MRIAESGLTNPAAGVIPTSPATAPEAAPSTFGSPRSHHSRNIHASAAAAPAVFVATNATTLSLPALNALPALNPNHPNQSRPAPSSVIVRLCGRMSSPG